MRQTALKLETAKPFGRAELQELDDNALVTAYLGGTSRAFDLLVERYQTRLLNFVYRTIGDRERAEDLVQEVFIRVYRHLHRFDRSKKFSTWVYTIASNLAKNELRNRSRNPLVLFQTMTSGWEDEERPLEFEDPDSRPDDAFDRQNLRELVDAAVRRLPVHHRQVFVLTGAGRALVRGNRRDDQVQPGHREVAAEPGPGGVCRSGGAGGLRRRR